MKKTEQELIADGWQKTTKRQNTWLRQNTWFKRVGRHFLFHNSSNGILYETDLDKDFKLHKGDKDLNSYLNFVFQTYGQKNSGQKYREKHQDWEFELAYHLYATAAHYPIFLTSPDGKRCYERAMISTDEKYSRGMHVIAEVETEKVLLKHFDNVVSNAMNKGFIWRR